jgi:hypothetical protein
MPTIDELAPATAAADTDEILTSQSGTTRKVTRAQIVSGLQPALAVPSGTVLGRASSGTGAPESLAIGANLVLNAGTISAETSYLVDALPAGTVPAPGDLVAMGQAAGNTAVPYSQFMAGLTAVAGLDASQMLVTPTGQGLGSKLADLTAAALPVAGGAMVGPLTLAADPSGPLQAATKQYVDSGVHSALPISGGTMTGSLTLAGDPGSSLQAATKQYVDAEAALALPKTGGTLSGALTLAGDPASASQAATKRYVDAGVASALPIGGGAMTGILTLAHDPAAPLQAATKQYVDAGTALALPRTGGTVSGALMLSSDPTAGLQAATKQYVDQQVGGALPLAGGTLSGALVLPSDPVSSSQAATKHYVDAQMSAVLPSTGGTLTGPLTLAADPIAPLQAATKHYVDSVGGSAGLSSAGGTLTGPLILAADPTTAMQAATKEYVDAQVSSALPKSGGSLTGPLAMGSNQLSGSAVALTGGAIDGIAIGGTTPSSIKGTTGSFSSTLSVAGTTSLTGGVTGSTTFGIGSGGSGIGVTVNNILSANYYQAFGGTQTLSGSAPTPRVNATGSNYTGSLSGTGYLSAFIVSSDSLAYTAPNAALYTTAIERNFGGTGTSGGRVALLTELSQTDVANVGAANSPQYVGANVFVQSSYNSGGTGPGQAGRGSWYSLNPQVLLLPGATYHQLANALGEINIAVYGTQQVLTLSGAATAGDVISLSFSSAGITGSPVTVSYTVGAGNSLGMMTANLQALIWNNANLRAVGLSATYNSASSSVLTLCWPLTLATVTVSATVTGAATETVSLGPVVSGASVANKLGMSIIRESGDTAAPDSFSAAIMVADQLTSPVAGWQSVLNVGGQNGSGSQFPVTPTGSIIQIGYQGAAGGNGSTQMFTPRVLTYGIDFRYGNFTRQGGKQYAGPGFAIGAAGSVSISNALLSSSSSGLNVDVHGFVGSGNASVVSGGGGGQGVQSRNYFPGDLVYDNYGGQHTVLTTNPATGAVLTLQTEVQPSSATATAPATSQTTFGGSGTGVLVIGINWVAANGLALNPSGGPTTVGGTLAAGSIASGGGIQRQAMASSSPASGSTLAIGTGVSDYRILGSNTLAALTLSLPSAQGNGQVIRVSSQVAVSALTVVDAFGSSSTVQSPPAALAAGGAFSAQWNATAAVWWCYVGA